MKKRLPLLFAFFAVMATVMAKPVTQATAMKVATTYLQSVTGKRYTGLTDITAQTPFQEFYVFTLGGEKGYILVSADDCVMPVLGYSESSPFKVEGMPTHVMEWLQMYDNQIAFYREKVGRLDYGGSREVENSWRNLSSGIILDDPLPTAVSPMLTTTWNQSPYYNNMCPQDASGTRSVTGCAATACAQIMKKWNHPTTGYSMHGYTPDGYGYQSVNYGSATYDWGSMPNALTSSSSTVQVNAVAKLMYHIGVAIEMNYSASGSGGATSSWGDVDNASVENALVYYFKYKPTCHSVYRGEFSDDEWAAMLRAELDANRPLLYTGYDTSGGHAFVFDGYDNQGNFHVNWGWGGSNDGYYTIGQLSPGAGGAGGNATYTFNLNNYALIGIEPNTSWSSYAGTTVSLSVSNASAGIVAGSGSYAFEDTIFMSASANQGNRFYKWSDGSTLCNRSMWSTGGSLSLTAIVEPLSGDTLDYCFNTHYATWGGGDNTTDVFWGIVLPAASVANHEPLTKVLMYVNAPGTYDLTVYAGSTPSASNSVYSHSYTFSETGWAEMELTAPVAVTGTQNIWLFVHNYGVDYPVPISRGCGNSHGSLYSFDSNPTQGFYTLGEEYACMIKAVFGNHDGDGGGTSGCTTVTIGDEQSNASSYHTPVNTYYNYSLTETIVDASEIGGPMTINSLSFYYTYATAMTSKTNCTIYVQPTTKTVFADASDIETLNSDAVMVYSGSLNCVQGWNEITFATPFEYDGSTNLMVIVDDNSGSYDGNSYKFRTSSCSGIKTLSWYSDYNNPDLANPSTFSGSTSYLTSRALMKLTGCLPCSPAVLEIGDVESTTSEYKVPYNTYYNYSLTESIIDAEEIGGPMDISGISYKYAHTTATNPTNCHLRIWIKPTTKSAFASQTDIELVDGNATLVYEGTPTFTQGWNDITFTNPYSYNGSGNIVVIVNDSANGYDGNAFKFYTSTTTGDKTLVWYSDSQCPDPTSNTYSGTKNRYSYRPVMKLQGCAYTTVSCPAPRVMSIVYNEYSADGDVATVVWDTAEQTSPEYETRWTQNNGTVESIYNWGHYGSHNFMAAYGDSSYIAVRAICGPGDTSEWSRDYLIYVPTPSYCQPTPPSVDGNGITNVYFGIGNEIVNNSQHPIASPYYGDYSNLTGAVPAGVECAVEITYATGYTYGTIIWVDWNQNLAFEGNEVVYVGESTSDPVATLTALFTVPANQPVGNYRMRIAGSDSYYNSYISSIAAAAEANPCPSSSWTIVHDYTLHVTESPSCMPVSGVAVTSIGATTATVTFNTSGAPSYDVYALTSTSSVACSTSTTSGTANLFGLTPGTDYYIRVQASCGNGVYSILTSPIHIVTGLCDANEQCPVTFVLTDQYGDGWNGGELVVIDSLTASTVATVAAVNHNLSNVECSDTVQMALCNGRDYIISYTQGNFDQEVSFLILDNSGETILSISSPSAGVQGNFTHNCQSSSHSDNDSLTVVVTINDATMGTISPTPGVHRYATNVNDTIVFSAMPNSGYGLYFWRLNYFDTVVRDLEQPTFSIVSSSWASVDTLFVQAFLHVPETLNVAITVNDPTMGTTNPTPGTYTYPEYSVMSMEAVPNNGYSFVEWLVAATSDGVTDTFTTVPTSQFNIWAYPSWAQVDLITLTAVFEAGSCDTYVITQSNPFTEGFEDGTLGSCWGNENVAGSAEWSVATGDHTATTGAHTGTYNAKLTHSITGNKTMLVTPLFDASALSMAQLNFWYVNRSWSGDIDKMAVYYRTSATAAWQLLDSVTEAHSTWTEATYNLPNTAVQVAFMMVDSYGYGVAIDDVVIGAAPSCLAVTGLTVTDVTTNSVTLSWMDAMNSGATYTVMQDGTTLVSGLAATTYTVNGLAGNTNYTFSVVANCSASDASNPSIVTVNTLPEPILCGNDPAVVFANADSATTTTNYCPAYSLYNYSYSEVIVPADRLYGMGEVKGIAFNVATVAAGSSLFNNCEIYMAHTDSLNLSNGFIQDSSNFQLVYSGDLSHSETGWMTVTFNNSFVYDGTSNVVVAVRRNDGNWASSGSFSCFIADAPLARYVYNDNGAYTIGTITGGTASSNVPLYHLIGCASSDTSSTDSVIVHIQYAVNDATMGTTNPAPGVYSYSVGEVFSVTAVPNPGYHLDSWEMGFVFPDYGYMSIPIGISTATLSDTAAAGLDNMILTAIFAQDVECQDSVAIPYFDGFEDGIECWSAANLTQTSGVVSNNDYVTNSYEGVKAFLFAFSDDATQYLITPRLANTGNGVEVEFYASVMSSVAPDAYQIGYSTTTNDTGAFVWLPAHTNLTNDTYQRFWDIIDVSGIRYVAIRHTPTNSPGIFIDNFAVHAIPSCYAVTSLAASVTASSVTLSWTDVNSTGATYTVYDMADTSVIATNIASTSYTVTGLNAATAYTFGVVANCSSTEASAITTVAVTTECDDITYLPYDEGFENGLGCWTTVNGSFSGLPWVVIDCSTLSDATPHGGNQVASSWSWDDQPINANAWLISPRFVLPNTTDSLVLTWWEKANASYPDHYSVVLSTTTKDTSSFTTVLRPYSAAAGVWTLRSVDLTAYAGQSIYIAFHHADYDMNYLLIDDISLLQGSFIPPAADTLTVTYAVNDPSMGTIVPAPGTYTLYVGNSIEATAVPNQGYKLAAWVYDLYMDGTLGRSDTILCEGDLFGNSMTFGTVTQDFINFNVSFGVTAIFEVDTTAQDDRYVTLITAVNDVTMGTITPEPGEHHYYAGETVHFSVTPNEGYHFENAHVTVSQFGMTLVDTVINTDISVLDLEVEEVMLGAVINVTANFARNNSVDLVGQVDDLKVFPNPTHGRVTVDADDVVKVDVMDVNGRVVTTFDNTNSIDISNLGAGTYMLRIETSYGTAVRRIVKH